MARQTYISCVEDASGRMIDFNRWAYKRPETIVQKHIDALRADGGFWRKIWRDGVTLAIYATPDGYNTEARPAYSVPLDVLNQAAQEATA